MIRTIYIGQQYANNMDISLGMANVVIKNMGDSISFTGIDLTKNQINLDNPAPGTGMVTAKLDLLYYNRTSVTGNILSSLVYIGGPTLLTDTSEQTYIPKNLYKNTQFEIGLNIPPNEYNFFMLNTTRLSALSVGKGDESIYSFPEKTMNQYGMPSVILGNDVIAKDGWYSVLSVGLCNDDISSGLVKAGMLVQQGSYGVGGDKPWYGKIYAAKVDGADASMLENTEEWEFMSEWPRTLPETSGSCASKAEVGGSPSDPYPYTMMNSLANVIGNYFPYNPWVRRDIFWLAQYDKIYRDAVIDYVETDSSLAASYPSIRAIHSSMDFYANKDRFNEAQLMLQGTDYYTTHYNFVDNV
jgi:hypothetical protein